MLHYAQAIGLGLILGVIGAGLVLALVVMPYKAWELHAFRAECSEMGGFVYAKDGIDPLCLSANWKIIAAIR